VSDLVALDGGPFGSHWYWLKDWISRQESARAHYLRTDQPPPAVLCYTATGRFRDHPREHGQGEVWCYAAPAKSEVEKVRNADGDPICPKCLLPCPRIIRWKTALGDYAECPRCLHTPYRELGSWYHSMPTKDLRWYQERGLL
jgi:hypothetical protein